MPRLRILHPPASESSVILTQDQDLSHKNRPFVHRKPCICDAQTGGLATVNGRVVAAYRGLALQG